MSEHELRYTPPKYTRYCFVPHCKNDSLKTPEKHFIHVPYKNKSEWCRAVGKLVVPKRQLVICEDHLDLECDLENYEKWKVSQGNAKLKPTVPFLKNISEPTKTLPKDEPAPSRRSKETCQPKELKSKKRKKTQTQDNILEKQGNMMAEELLNTKEQKEVVEDSTDTMLIPEDTATLICNESFDTDQDLRRAEKALKEIEETQTKETKEKALQELEEAKTKETSVQATPVTVNHIKPESKAERTNFNINKTIPASSTKPVSVKVKENTPEQQAIADACVLLQITVKRIIRKLKFYTGLPVSCCYLINIIGDKTKIPEHHLLLCLKKIRLDSGFLELADDFAVTPADASQMFLKNIPLLASVLRPFILNQYNNISTLPLALRHKYNNVTCIIDCLEIKIQKTSNSIQTDSVKYLISCTPNGVINYVSQGYNGKIKDTNLVNACDLMDYLSEGMCVMVESGLKDIEFLRTSGLHFVRTPSFRTNVTGSEAQQIEALRKPMRTVMRRLREFVMLNPHECLKRNVVKVIDEIVIIACAFVNLHKVPGSNMAMLRFDTRFNAMYL